MSLVEQLTRLPTCDLCDALQTLGVPLGGYLHGIKMMAGRRLCGPIYTVKYEKKEEATKKLPGHYIDTVPKDRVVFISAPEVPTAVYGGLMSTRAKTIGALGAVVDGNIRDYQEHAELGFPVFSKGVSSCGPKGTVVVTDVDVPVQVAGNKLESGDYIVGDEDGIVWIPQKHINEAIRITMEIIEDNQNVGKEILNGLTFQDAAKKHRRH